MCTKKLVRVPNLPAEGVQMCIYIYVCVYVLVSSQPVVAEFGACSVSVHLREG